MSDFNWKGVRLAQPLYIVARAISEGRKARKEFFGPRVRWLFIATSRRYKKNTVPEKQYIRVVLNKLIYSYLFISLNIMMPINTGTTKPT